MEIACVNCFSSVDAGTRICPCCGFDLGSETPHPCALMGGTLLKERYVTGRVIGTGGFGITYLSYDTQCEKVVAVKEYYPHGVAVRSEDGYGMEPLGSVNAAAYSEGIERFLREGGYIARFRNAPEIMGIYDVFEENGTAYHVTDFLNGLTLKEYTDRYGRIEPSQAFYIAERIARAFSIIHEGGIIHRDVSPDNIMLCRDGGVRLIDFGAARPLSADNGMTVMLKYGFTPLEQYQHSGVQGAWTDIYSLGATLYYALTLSMPEDPMSRLDDDSNMEDKLSAMPSALAELITRCCAVRIKERCGSGAELLEILSRGDIAPCGFDAHRLRGREVYSPATKLTYLKGKTVQSVKIGGEMIPVDITELRMTERQLTNAQVQNLRHLKRLEKLYLDNNFITDLSCISGLTELREVSFNNNNLHDIEFARGMRQLRHISGENSGVEDISPLAGKSELVSVFFGDAFVTDISPLKECSRLEMVGFNEARLPDISALADKPLLTMVCFAGCGLTDISPLKGSPLLSKVYFGRNRLTDLSPLRGCNIDELYVDNNLLSEGVESFAGIIINGFIAADGNRFTEEDVSRIKQLAEGDFEIYI